MKLYVLYTSHWGNTRPLRVSIDKADCEEEIALYRNAGSDAMLWIKEYDLSDTKGFDLDLE